jgi:hypothetical protein
MLRPAEFYPITMKKRKALWTSFQTRCDGVFGSAIVNNVLANHKKGANDDSSNYCR